MAGKDGYVMVRIDPELKARASEIFRLVGLDMSAAVRLFFHQTVLTGGIPFRLSRDREANDVLATDEVVTHGRTDAALESALGMDEHYSPAERARAVDLFFQLKNAEAVIARLGYPAPAVLTRWVREDPRYTSDLMRTRHFDFDTRLAAVRAYVDGQGTLNEISNRFGMSARQLYRWVKTYREEGPEALRPYRRKGSMR